MKRDHLMKKGLMTVRGDQKFHADPKTNMSSQLIVFWKRVSGVFKWRVDWRDAYQLAKMQPQTNLHWYA